jgi:hypothetical protein
MELVTLYQFISDFRFPIKILHHENDVGPCLKLFGLFPILDQFQHDHILIFDDDTAISPACVTQLYNSHDSESPGILGCMGVNPPHFIHGESIPANQTCVDVRVLGGYRGILYPVSIVREYKTEFTEFFQLLCEEYHVKLNTIPLHDDHIFASFFRKHQVPFKVVKITAEQHPSFQILENSNGIFNSNNNDAQLCVLKEFLENLGYDFN